MRRTLVPVVLLSFLAASLSGQAQEKGVINVSGVHSGSSPSKGATGVLSSPGFEFTPRWEGRSLDPEPGMGLRVMRPVGGSGWRAGIEYTHLDLGFGYAGQEPTYEEIPGVRIQAGLGSPAAPEQFSEGVDILTANGERELFALGPLSTRAGLGLGVAMPEGVGDAPVTADPLGAGPAARWYFSATLDLIGNASAYAEYNGLYSASVADALAGGNPDRDILENALSLGIGFSF